LLRAQKKVAYERNLMNLLILSEFIAVCPTKERETFVYLRLGSPISKKKGKEKRRVPSSFQNKTPRGTTESGWICLNFTRQKRRNLKRPREPEYKLHIAPTKERD
jgi:hypothetical protein